MKNPSRSERKSSMLQELNQVLDRHLDQQDPDFLAQVLGQLLHSRQRYDKGVVSTTTVPWMLDAYVGLTLEDAVPGMLKLHQFLVEKGACAEKPFDFGYADRFGAAFADEPDWKSMALQTQSFTYMVVLSKKTIFSFEEDGSYQSKDQWLAHLRLATPSRHSYDYSRPNFASLSFLSDPIKVEPDGKYSDQAHEYFMYKDGRDRGYLASMYFDGRSVVAKDVTWGAAYTYLRGILYDMMAHASCIPKETPLASQVSKG